MKKIEFYLVTGLIALSFFGSPMVFADSKEYKVPVLNDFSGPYADTAKRMLPGAEAIIKWWNDGEGKNLGVKLVLKNYDTRYSAATVASIWPGILAEKPIVAFATGGGVAAALQQRLPDDKVPIVWNAPGYGFGWLPNQWIFYPRPTYTHEWLGGFMWYINQHPEKRPVKLATMCSQAQAAGIDITNGVVNYVKNVLEPKGLAKIVAQEWIDYSPVDISSQMKKVIDAKADIIYGIVTTGMAQALQRAQQMHGVSIPMISWSFFSFWPLAMASKSFESWEGHYSVGAVANEAERGGKAYDFFKMLQNKYGLGEENWEPLGLIAFSQSVLGVRAVERAARKVGGANLNGQAVYDAFFDKAFTEDELMGILPTLYFTKEAPFSVKELKVKIATVKNGKYQMATPEWVPIPSDVKKW